VRFLGHRDDAREVLAACDAYANSSTFEGVSLTILEAMAASLPVVATAVGGTPEIVSRDTGLLVPARSPEAVAAALASLAADPTRSAALGAAGRAAVLARFTLDRMVDDYVRVYRGQ
jgi:glycosyltransferase involved in cell wall biosynthesis